VPTSYNISNYQTQQATLRLLAPPTSFLLQIFSSLPKVTQPALGAPQQQQQHRLLG
jgi:hypothetical protein